MTFTSLGLAKPILDGVRAAGYETPTEIQQKAIPMARQGRDLIAPVIQGLESLVTDAIKAGEIQLVFTTVDETRTAIADSRSIRTAALANRVTYYTTMAGAEAVAEAIAALRAGSLEVRPLQGYF